MEAAGEYLKSRFLKVFNDPLIVDWLKYGEDVYKKAGDLTADGDQLLTIPESTVTKALVLHARLCLRPPG